MAAGDNNRPHQKAPFAFIAGMLLLSCAMVGSVGTPETTLPLGMMPGLQERYQQMNQQLVDHLTGLGDEPSPQEAIQVARLALQQRETLLQELGHLHSSGLFAQQHRNLDLAKELSQITDKGHESGLEKAVELAKSATKWQAASLGLDWADPVALEGHEKPSMALLELAARHQAAPDDHELQRILELDSHSEPLRSALARFVDAFLAFETAAQDAYADVGASKIMDESNRIELQAELIQALQGDPVGFPTTGQRFQEKGIDLSHLLPTRNQFLDAIVDLHAALEGHEVIQMGECEPVQVAPVFSVDLSHCDNHYTENFVLLLDAGGSDIYHNNAGGNGIGPECDVFRAAAALVDLGEGDDEIGHPVNPLSCGVNGGGAIGAGFLFNEQGNNSYSAGDLGTNGSGGYYGTGFLLDVTGDDRYVAGGYGTNGGAFHVGLSMLIDTYGNDFFAASQLGTNGGGDTHGIGFLFSGEGDSSFTTSEGGVLGNGGTNGGGAVFGIGVLINSNGDSTFKALNNGSNGGAFLEGVGFLLNAGGNNEYRATHRGTNGGAFGSGLGMLVDLSGDDQYHATNNGTNGGARASLLLGASLPVIGVLLDFDGNDVYAAGDLTSNGGADENLSIGLLFDANGGDFYQDQMNSCWDCTLIPKGTLGAQVDSDDIRL